MTLREQILSELQQQNEVAQRRIQELDNDISNEAFVISTLTSGAFSNAARSACEHRMETARAEASRIKQQNAWTAEMLSKYQA